MYPWKNTISFFLKYVTKNKQIHTPFDIWAGISLVKWRELLWFFIVENGLSIQWLSRWIRILTTLITILFCIYMLFRLLWKNLVNFTIIHLNFLTILQAHLTVLKT